jgi:hypothetical protein
MSAGELLRNHPDTFWLIHQNGRYAEQQAMKRARKSRTVITKREGKPDLVTVKLAGIGK